MSEKCQFCLGEPSGGCDECNGSGVIDCSCHSGISYKTDVQTIQNECNNCGGKCQFWVNGVYRNCQTCGGRGWRFYNIEVPIEGTGRTCIACNGVGAFGCLKCNGTGDLMKCDCPEWLLQKEREDADAKIKEAKDDKTILISLICIIPIALIGYFLEKKDATVAPETRQQPKTAEPQSRTANDIHSKTRPALTSTVPKVIPVRQPDQHVDKSDIERPKYNIPQGVPPDSPKYYSMPQRDNFQPLKGNPQNAGDKSVDLAKQYSKADKQLNDAYKIAMARLDTQGKERLRFEQRNWVKNRDDAASRNPTEAEPIKLKMTILRTRELEQYR